VLNEIWTLAYAIDLPRVHGEERMHSIIAATFPDSLLRSETGLPSALNTETVPRRTKQ